MLVLGHPQIRRGEFSSTKNLFLIIFHFPLMTDENSRFCLFSRSDSNEICLIKRQLQVNVSQRWSGRIIDLMKFSSKLVHPCPESNETLATSIRDRTFDIDKESAHLNQKCAPRFNSHFYPVFFCHSLKWFNSSKKKMMEGEQAIFPFFLSLLLLVSLFAFILDIVLFVEISNRVKQGKIARKKWTLDEEKREEFSSEPFLSPLQDKHWTYEWGKMGLRMSGTFFLKRTIHFSVKYFSSISQLHDMLALIFIPFCYILSSIKRFPWGKRAHIQHNFSYFFVKQTHSISHVTRWILLLFHLPNGWVFIFIQHFQLLLLLRSPHLPFTRSTRLCLKKIHCFLS